MSNDEPQSQRDREPNTVGASPAVGRPRCMPMRRRGGKRTAAQQAEPAGEQATAAPSDVPSGRAAGCGCSCNDE